MKREAKTNIKDLGYQSIPLSVYALIGVFYFSKKEGGKMKNKKFGKLSAIVFYTVILQRGGR
jgi:hypothetical protein